MDRSRTIKHTQKFLRVKLRVLFFIILGLLDKITSSRIRNKMPNVIVFHEINEKCSIHSDETNTGLKQTYFTRLLNQLQKRDWARGNHLLLTFDDGYFLNDEIMEELVSSKLKIICFVNTNTLFSGLRYETLLRYKDEILTDDLRRQILKNKPLQGDWEDEKIKDLSEELVESINAFQGRYFTSKEVSEIAKTPIVLGDHFVDHLDVAQLRDEELVEGIIRSNRVLLEEGLDVTKTFAMPHGLLKPSQINVLKRLGYRQIFGGSAFSILRQKIGVIPRVQVADNNHNFIAIRGELFFNRLVYGLKHFRISDISNR